MIKSVRDLTDIELSDQCIKKKIDQDGLSRTQKIRTLMSSGLKSVYIPIQQPLKQNVSNFGTQTFLRQAYNTDTKETSNETVEYESVTQPVHSTEPVIPKSLTTNVVVTDSVHTNLGVNKNIYVNGKIYLRDRILNPDPSFYYIESNNQTIFIDLNTNNYTFCFQNIESDIQCCITITNDAKLFTGNKGLIKCINKENFTVSVKFDSDAKIGFSINETQTLKSKSQFSFEYFVINDVISVNFIESTPESRAIVANNTSISELKEFQSENVVKIPPLYNNSQLVTKQETDGTSGVQWRYLSYFEPLINLNNNIWIHYFKHYYANYKIIVSDNYEYFTKINEIPHIILGYFGYVDKNEEEAEGMHGYIYIKNERSNDIPIILGFSPYAYDVFNDNSKPFYGWSASFPVSENSISIPKNTDILLEYTVIRTGNDPLIVTKVINTSVSNDKQIEDSDFIVVNVSYKQGKFRLFDQTNNTQLHNLKRGQKYRFVYEDTSYNQHLLRFSNRNDGFFL
jgi:hypothetical protein